MSAKSAIEFVAYGGIIPLVAAIVIFFGIQWLLPQEAARRYQAAVAFAAAVFFGYAFLPSTKSLVPSEFWEWIPWLGLLAAFQSGLTRAAGITHIERWLVVAVLALAAAWLLVPTWPTLAPSRTVQVIGFTTATIVVTTLLLPLPERLPGSAFPFWLMAASGAASVLITAEVSETFGMLASLPAAALAGCGVAAWLGKSPCDWRVIILPFLVVAGGYAYLGAVYPTTPIWPLLLLPVTLLMLWLCAVGPLARLPKLWSIAAQGACVLTPIILVAAAILSRSAAGEDW